MLRPGRPEDGPGIAEVYLATWRSHGSDLLRRSDSKEDKAVVEEVKQTLGSQAAEEQSERFTAFLRNKQRLFVVAEAEPDSLEPERQSCLCGFISYGRSFTREGFGEVMQLYVHPGWQRRGLGTRLLREAWRDLSQQEWASLGSHVWCTKGNPANRVYEQVGWVPTGREKSLSPTLSKEPVEVEEYQAPSGGPPEDTPIAASGSSRAPSRRSFAKFGLLALALGAALLAHLLAGEDRADPSTATMIRVEAVSGESDARCLDGSSPTYYFRRGYGSGSRSWLLYFQGGGWCVPQDESPPGFPPSLVDACKARARRSLGSTRHDSPAENLSVKRLFSQDEGLNPAFFNWNVVKLRYCDGASFADSAGSANFRATLRSLLAAGLADAAKVVVSGCSAGAVAAALHAGAVGQAVPEDAVVAGLLDSGLFPDWSRADPAQTGASTWPPAVAWPMDAELRKAVAGRDFVQAGTLPAECLQHHAEAPWRCLFLEHLLPFVKVPCFVLQSRFDSSLVRSLEPGQGIELLGQSVAWRLHTALDNSAANHALFLDSCFHHCRSWGEIAGSLSAGQGLQTQPEAFLAWWRGLVEGGSGRRSLRWEHRCPASSGGPCWDQTSCMQTTADLAFWNRTFSWEVGS